MATTDWVSTSVMGRLGVAAGKSGATHVLTEAEQDAFHYVYGPYAAPRVEVDPGDLLVVETVDAFGGAIRSEQDLPSEKTEFPFLNPQSGPIYVRGARKGDALAVQILDVAPRGEQPSGTTCLIPEFGGLVGTADTAMLNAPLPERVKKVTVTESGILWDNLVLPYEPFIGSIGVSPQIAAISSLQPDTHGGNMDHPDVRPGAIVYFPVSVDGALLYLGDCHASQGDGELTGVAIEQPATVRLRVDVVPGWSIPGPRVETEDFIMSLGSARPMEDATRMAYRDLIRWMAADHGFDPLDAYMLLGQVGRVRLGNMVDPKYTVGASILKQYLGG